MEQSRDVLNNRALKQAAIAYLEAVGAYFDFKREPEELLDIKNVVKNFGINRAQLAELLMDPALPRVLLGKSKRVFIPRRELAEYIAGRSKHWFEYD